MKRKCTLADASSLTCRSQNETVLVFQGNDLLALMLNCHAVGGGHEASSLPMSCAGCPARRKYIKTPRPNQLDFAAVLREAHSP